MDIERGNIEILFQKIPYMYLLAPKDCSESFLGYNKVDEGLYMRYAADMKNIRSCVSIPGSCKHHTGKIIFVFPSIQMIRVCLIHFWKMNMV